MKDIFTSVMENLMGNFNGNYTLVVLYVLSLCVLFFVVKKKLSTTVLWYSLLLTVIILCPITAKILLYGLGNSVYWRMLWLYPVVPVASTALALLIGKCKKSMVRFLLFVLCCGALAFCGTSVINRENFDKTSNYEKLPQYVIGVCDLINADAEEHNITVKKLATNPIFLVYVREYDSTLLMENSRQNMRGWDKREKAQKIYEYMCGTAFDDYSEFAELLREESCNYVVFDMGTQPQMAEGLAEYGFVLVGNYEQFAVYRDEVDNVGNTIEQKEVVAEYKKNDDGWLIGQYASVTGQQSSFYTISDHEGHLIVIDGGWEEDATYVKQVIDYFGGKVDAWIITHPHFDHVRAFNSLLASEDCPTIGEIYVSEFDYEQYKDEAKEWDQFGDYETFLEVTKDASNLTYLHAGDSFELLGLQVDVYHDYTTKVDGDACNDGSLVFEVTGKKESMLFCGDTGKSQAETIMNAYGDELKADYLQMGHHGNGGLTEEFYKLVDPKGAFFDAPEWLMNPGEDTKYTTPENKELMESMGAEIFDFSTAPNYIVLY